MTTSWPEGSQHDDATPPEVIAVGETMGCFVLRDGSAASEMTFIGAESNVAIALASLDHRVRWVSRLGDDQVGDHIVRALRDRGVDVWASRDEARSTGIAIKELDANGTAVRYYRKDSAASVLRMEDVPPLTGASWLHLTGITPALSTGCAELTDRLAEQTARSGVRLSVDVNLRPVLWPSSSHARDAMLRLCRSADLVFVGHDESSALGLGDTAEEFIDAVGISPDRVVVFKRGSRGADAWSAGVGYSSAALPSPVVDVTGAGDAFAAGFLGGMLRRLPVGHCLELGHLMASRVIGVPRDFADPPGPAEAAALDLLLDKASHDIPGGFR